MTGPKPGARQNEPVGVVETDSKAGLDDDGGNDSGVDRGGELELLITELVELVLEFAGTGVAEVGNPSFSFRIRSSIRSAVTMRSCSALATSFAALGLMLLHTSLACGGV